MRNLLKATVLSVLVASTKQVDNSTVWYRDATSHMSGSAE